MDLYGHYKDPKGNIVDIDRYANQFFYICYTNTHRRTAAGYDEVLIYEDGKVKEFSTVSEAYAHATKLFGRLTEITSDPFVTIIK